MRAVWIDQRDGRKLINVFSDGSAKLKIKGNGRITKKVGVKECMHEMLMQVRKERGLGGS